MVCSWKFFGWLKLTMWFAISFLLLRYLIWKSCIFVKSDPIMTCKLVKFIALISQKQTRWICLRSWDFTHETCRHIIPTIIELVCNYSKRQKQWIPNLELAVKIATPGVLSKTENLKWQSKQDTCKELSYSLYMILICLKKSPTPG